MTLNNGSLAHPFDERVHVLILETEAHETLNFDDFRDNVLVCFPPFGPLVILLNLLCGHILVVLEDAAMVQ